MEVEYVWTIIPTASDTDGNAVFVSSQYWHEAPHAAGYMGTQVLLDIDRGVERRIFIFACWDAEPQHQVSGTTASCTRFGHEGNGSHCSLDLPVQRGVPYRFRVAQSGSNSSGAFWTGTVLDTSSNTTHTIGTLFQPNVGGYTGFGKLKVQSDVFLEYFGGGDCEGAATVGVGIVGPYYHNRTLTAKEAYPLYKGGHESCNRSVVERCIPGKGCGRPNVLLMGGKGIVRDTADEQPLWIQGLTLAAGPNSTSSQIALITTSRTSARGTLKINPAALTSSATNTAFWTTSASKTRRLPFRRLQAVTIPAVP